ncbi:endoplasmic reticulum resident protein 29 [Pararge aegeria]|uniref:Endoplasmic reticulum resident protein 29 n=2 Tax=Pararge aegeria TaxID=116150 RepID=A0A8S4RF56_9NEOP|nr:endoplasmic reticulum resident protein 29 [Pararge aegeria]CAH2233956.1 jg21436 [Pararge aegeria aegeria]
MRLYITVFCYFILTVSTNLVSAAGSVELNEYTFDKIVSKFGAALVKFDVAFPFGDKHDAFVALAKEAKDIDELLFADVGIKDYGERENEQLGRKYGATKDNIPVVKLFLKGKSEPIHFDDTKGFTSDDLRRFVRENSGIYLSLPGCIRDLDVLAIKFQGSAKEDREKILKETENIVEKLDTKDAAAGKTYRTIMQKILEKGDEFIATEINRINKLLSGKVSNEKKKELASRINILQSFKFSSSNKKEEL